MHSVAQGDSNLLFYGTAAHSCELRSRTFKSSSNLPVLMLAIGHTSMVFAAVEGYPRIQPEVDTRFAREEVGAYGRRAGPCGQSLSTVAQLSHLSGLSLLPQAARIRLAGSRPAACRLLDGNQGLHVDCDGRQWSAKSSGSRPVGSWIALPGVPVVRPYSPSGATAYFEVPSPHRVEELRLQDGAVILLRQHGNPDGPRLVVSSGNGLAIDLYFPYWSLLLDKFDLLLFDLRNQGANPLGERSHHTIPSFRRDLEAVCQTVDRAFGMHPKAGVFHSVSSLAAVLSPSLESEFSALVCFDPPFCASESKHRIFESACRQAAMRTRNRLGLFPSEWKFVKFMNASPGMARLVPNVAELMARTTLRYVPDGAFELRCPPNYEAQILAAMPTFSRMVDVELFALPTKVIGADPSIRHYFLPPCDLSHVESVNFEAIPGTTHLAQLERPAECARLTTDFLSRIGFSAD